MRKCEKCGAVLDPEEAFCRKCGLFFVTPEEEYTKSSTCNQCGKEGLVSRFNGTCPKCDGVKLKPPIVQYYELLPKINDIEDELNPLIDRRSYLKEILISKYGEGKTKIDTEFGTFELTIKKTVRKIFNSELLKERIPKEFLPDYQKDSISWRLPTVVLLEEKKKK